MIRLNKNLVPVLFAGMVITGCATSRGVLDIQVLDIPNPNSSESVKIVEVSDNRVFEIKPKQPSIPSLKNDEIYDPSITKRAVARKRSGFGAALGDILLPEGRTVEQVTEAALVKALRESGYRVVSKGESGYETALPLRAEIEQFWAWFNPGFWQIKLTYNAKILLKGDWPIKGENRIVEGNAIFTGSVASGAEWREVITKGVNDLIENVKSILKKVST